MCWKIHKCSGRRFVLFEDAKRVVEANRKHMVENQLYREALEEVECHYCNGSGIKRWHRRIVGDCQFCDGKGKPKFVVAALTHQTARTLIC